MESTDQDLLFSGLKVIDVASWIAGPVAATILADYGADVIKIEMPGVGDGYRALAAAPGMPASDSNYTWLMDARNKRSLTLNLKDPRGKAILLRLVADCDVYVTNQPMPMRRSLGLTYEDLKSVNPRIIYASLTAYGESGPERDREGFDLVAYWARTGLMDLVRTDNAEPAQSLPGMGDHPSAVALYAAIVTALLRRERTGKGSEVHTSLLANGLWAASCIAQARLVDADFSGWRSPSRVGVTRPVYRAADDRWLQFTMVRTPQEIEAFFRTLDLDAVIALPRFATPEARLDNGAELVGYIRDRISALPSAQWLSRFHSAGVPAALMGTLDDLVADAQLAINRMTVPGAASGGTTHRLINHPVNVEGLARCDTRAPPALGEHSDEVLEQLGFTPTEIAQLHEQQVI
jgi:crotonobetainyl-CoA:carnitine CoA-transferase CaiB-like acyl-CoA transferase